MTHLRRQAILHLVICAAAAIAVSTLYLTTHDVRASLAGFAMLSLVGFAHLASRRRLVVADERDAATQRRAAVASYTVFWLLFVVWGVAVSLRFGEQETVPIVAVEPVVWAGAWVVISVRAAAILIFDAKAS